MEFDIDKIVSELDFDSNKFKYINKNITLTNREISVLEQYKINYKQCGSLKEILFLIEDVIRDLDVIPDELDNISSSIAERDYYQNTNK